MRLLVDQNVPRDVVDGLREDGQNVTWAQQENRVVITLDTDFGTLAVHRDRPTSSGIILFRLTLIPPVAVTQTVREAIRSREDWEGHVSVVDDTQIRMRPLPE